MTWNSEEGLALYVVRYFPCVAFLTPEDHVFAFQPLKARTSHIVLVVLVAIAALIASVVLPSVRAAAAPVGTSAEVPERACGSDVRIKLANNSGSSQQFDLWQYGDRTPYTSVALVAGTTTTVSRRLEETSQRLSVRINGFALANQVVSRSDVCDALEIPALPNVVDGRSATVVSPACGGNATIHINNGSREPNSFGVVRGSAAEPEQVITVGERAAIGVTIAVTSSVEIVQVHSDGAVISSGTVTPSAPCAQPSMTTDGLRAPFGEWGAPVRVEDFNGSTLQVGSNGWQVYDSPRGKVARTKSNVRVGQSESGTGELQIVGSYDRSKGVHIGGGLADSFAQQYGRWEVRARTDKGAGFAPIILLWPHGGHWPNDGEIDLLEAPKGNRLGAITVLHNGPANRFRTHGLDGDHSEWHTYAVEWLPSRVTFYLDGVEQWMVTDASLIPKTSPMHLAMQLDAGCGWIQCPNAQTAPETLLHIDWIKAYAAPASML